jgi:hypothetical protein
VQCEYVADFVSTHAHSFLVELQTSVCTCLGCCGAAEDAHSAAPSLSAVPTSSACYFPNHEQGWIKEMVDRVSAEVSEKLAAERTAKESARRRTQADQARREREGEDEERREEEADSMPHRTEL